MHVDGNRLVSSPLTTTLVLGEREAALVDPPLTRERTSTVADWVERSCRRLTHIYATHGHGDHWFGTAELIPWTATTSTHHPERDTPPSRRRTSSARSTGRSFPLARGVSRSFGEPRAVGAARPQGQ
ncbi:MBL fold metallo-hydrolase [Streptomyces mirabilis]|uniref:MBL fold metallo-hydrolase n=1 Tax=Streptomyces mirabilis TaxID=68239 RepID=A0ABU3V596_9ACTN|nr:MBL fold metallo-hydrolase [Streptomyces mirabilis]MCX5355689.1 MBL fold metallo-hydrolase [Streptomyces mirabilis]MDU9001332.1 MBL fold metallo-hydrolase [Streptomyces mirabilis]